ncbi:YcdB/YcdC domain-containing protein [Ammoniphilus resinae]|uniref:YcdB/YcdC repeated domain-containing protein n=1 Tax=Ammoniphilus resinae TaxID=861532 RepID=A0ABS4GP08_9BACL|nr:hypothetical protein [Ammoniphilus resinae]
MFIDNEQLRVIVKTIFPIPKHYLLEMEDSIPKGNEQERCFIWEDPENRDNKIEIALDLTTGLLTRLEIDLEYKDESKQKPKELNGDEEAKNIADAFVAKHAPNSAEFTSVIVKKRPDGTEFIFRQEVGGLPLPHTGCDLILDRELNVVRFRLKGRGNQKTQKPEWPDAIVDEKTVTWYIQNNLRMKLAIVSLHPTLYEMKGTEHEYRLVYEPIPDRPFLDAVTGVDIFGPEHYVMPPSHPLPPIESMPKPSYDKALSLEQLLDIDIERYVLEKSEDDGERIKSLYQLREREEKNPETEALTADAYMERKWGDKLRIFRESAIMVQLEKKTGRLVGFHRMGWNKVGIPSLSREQCWQKAEHFLGIVFPDYARYLQLEIDNEKLDGEPREREFFYLPVYIDGIPVNHERITISINTSTGDVCTYIGVSYEMIQELSDRSFLPNITPEVAFDRYIENLQLRLKWFLDNDQEVPLYRLLYVPTTLSANDPEGDRTLRYIDAVTGEHIWRK